MCNLKFIIYSIFTSALWGGLLFAFTTQKINSTGHLIWFLIVLYLITELRDYLIKSKTEKEDEKNKLNEPLTLKSYLKSLPFLFFMVFAFVIYAMYGETLANLLPINTISSAIIGAMWALSIHVAWNKREAIT